MTIFPVFILLSACFTCIFICMLSDFLAVISEKIMVGCALVTVIVFLSDLSPPIADPEYTACICVLFQFPGI